MGQSIHNAKEFLARLQSADGGWPYREGAQCFPEPTCYGLLASYAGGNSGFSEDARVRGIGWLERLVSPDGAIVLDGDTGPNWATALLVLTLTRLGRSEDLKERCARWLLSLEGEPMEATKEVPFDSSLQGWPWMDATFSWVEPTSYALLALKASGHGDHPRVAEAEKLLLDRGCADGGWNYGNREVLGRELPPFVPTTAWAVMALQECPDAGTAIDGGLDYLEKEVGSHPSALSLSLGILAFDIHGRSTDRFANMLTARQEPDGSWRRAVYLTALATLALDSLTGGANVFRL
ncbi:MAG: terpene cyclase/mutase family protein [bacterium]